jgi:hypothetical protein
MVRVNFIAFGRCESFAFYTPINSAWYIVYMSTITSMATVRIFEVISDKFNVVGTYKHRSAEGDM